MRTRAGLRPPQEERGGARRRAGVGPREGSGRGPGGRGCGAGTGREGRGRGGEAARPLEGCRGCGGPPSALGRLRERACLRRCLGSAGALAQGGGLAYWLRYLNGMEEREVTNPALVPSLSQAPR